MYCILSPLWTMYSLSEQNAKMADTHTNFIVEAKYFKANKLVGQKCQNGPSKHCRGDLNISKSSICHISSTCTICKHDFMLTHPTPFGLEESIFISF